MPRSTARPATPGGGTATSRARPRIAVQVPRWTSYSSIQPTGRPARWSSWTPGWAAQVRWTRPSSSSELRGSQAAGAGNGPAGRALEARYGTPASHARHGPGRRVRAGGRPGFRRRCGGCGTRWRGRSGPRRSARPGARRRGAPPVPRHRPVAERSSRPAGPGGAAGGRPQPAGRPRKPPASPHRTSRSGRPGGPARRTARSGACRRRGEAPRSPPPAAGPWRPVCWQAGRPGSPGRVTPGRGRRCGCRCGRRWGSWQVPERAFDVNGLSFMP